MAKIRSAWVDEDYNNKGNLELIRAAEASECLIKGLAVIDRLVKPKQFNMSNARLLRFEVQHNGLNNHGLNVVGENPIDEVTEWQIIGTVQDRIINCVVNRTFHTFERNRSGTARLLINGKTDYKPEYGGVTLEDIYQESGLYKNFMVQSHGVFKNDRSGKLVSIAH